jgi:hypothetical protein
MDARCTRGDSRSRPRIQSPRRVGSVENARSPSAARGAPEMFPTKVEKRYQFIPNWSSSTIPVTTPVAKLMRKG